MVLTPGSMDRCVNEDDWVRKEITEALEVGCNFVPILIDEKDVSYPDNFPRKLNIIKNIQASKLLTNEFFEESVKRIANRLQSKKKEAISNTRQIQIDFVLTISTDETCNLFINGELIKKIKKGKLNKVANLTAGEDYILEFQSLAIKKDVIRQTYKCPKINKTDELTISFKEMRAQKKKLEAEEKDKKQRVKEAKLTNKQNLKNALQYYDRADVSVYDGMMLVQKGDLFGFIDEKGFETIFCQYENALHFQNGVACVKKNGKWGFININGQNVIPFESDTPSYYSHNLIIICKDGKFGAIDINGTICIPLNYDYLSQPSDKVIIGMLNNEMMLMNLEGEEINSKRFDSVGVDPVPLGIEADDKLQYWHSWDGYELLERFPDIFDKRPIVPCIVQKNKRYGYLDTNGKIIIPIIAENMYHPNLTDSEKDKFLITKYREKWGVFNAQTGAVFIPFEYEYVETKGSYDKNPFFVVGDNVIGKIDHGYRIDIYTSSMGAIDLDGKFFIPMEYNLINYVKDAGRCFDSKEDFMYFIHTGYRSVYIALKIIGDIDIDRLPKLDIDLDLMDYFGIRSLSDFDDTHYIIDFYAREISNGQIRTIKFLKKEHVPGCGIHAQRCHEVLFEREL